MARRASTPRWQDAVQRGSILGCVLAGHFAILMLVLHPSWRHIEHVPRLHEDQVLRLRFDRLPKLVRPSLAPAAIQLPAQTKPAPQAIALSTRRPATGAHSSNPPAAPAATLTMAMPMMTGDPHRSYLPGDFQSALQNAQRTKADHIPGTTTPLIGGIRLQASSSTKAAVHGLVEENRCANMQFQLQNSAHQFTPEMIDHALEVEGCGPHLERTAADATIDAIAHQAIFGN
jgi:hypothetical protein